MSGPDDPTAAGYIAEITEILEPIAGTLQAALTTANEYMQSDFAYQWKIDYAWAESNWVTGELELRSPQTITVPTMDFPVIFHEPYTWKPQVGNFIPAWTSQQITGAERQDYPPAREARNYFVNEIPSIGTNTDAQSKNVYDIIELPRALKDFHETWVSILNEIMPMGEAISEIRNLQTRGFSWSGTAFEVYREQARIDSMAAEAAQVAIEVIEDGMFALADMVLRLVGALAEIAKKNIDDVVGIVDTLVSLVDATKWYQQVAKIAGFVGENLKDQIDAADASAETTRADADAIRPFDTLSGAMSQEFGQLNVDSGDLPYPTWPKPKGDITQGWQSSGTNLEVEIGYLGAARNAWLTVEKRLRDAYAAALAGGNIPSVSDQSGRFTDLISKLNELKDHVQEHFLLAGAERAQAMADGLYEAATNYINNENLAVEQARELEDLLNAPSEGFLVY